MKVAFFTEAGTKRGMGHLIRCQTFASKFQQVDFFLDTNVDYSYKFNNLKYFNWNNLTLQDFYDIIFIDSYEATKSVYDLLVTQAKITVYIDDYERLSYPQGIIINFAPNAEKLFFKKRNIFNDYLLGLEYIPIRNIFIKYQKNIKENKIFIMLGGGDTANLSEKVIYSLKDINLKKVIVVNSEKTKIELQKYKDTEVLFKPSDEELIKQMSSSSFAISTASMTLYELSFLKIPTIIIAVSQNQLIGVNQMIDNNLACSYIDIKKSYWEISLKIEIEKLIKNKIEVKQKIDGLGTKRIYEYIIKRLER
ncbi:hypothetical protein ACNSOP_03125 [Aliarcobacter lanthieri]|uniref:hypothetical protein n=1 Tax=Aliarcobacter lanthieri TaxID=1355374 RepID=UPI003AA8F1EC